MNGMSLPNFLHSLQSRPKDELLGLSETNSRKWIVDPVLQELGWNTDRWSDDREVIEEYTIVAVMYPPPPDPPVPAAQGDVWRHDGSHEPV